MEPNRRGPRCSFLYKGVGFSASPWKVTNPWDLSASDPEFWRTRTALSGSLLERTFRTCLNNSQKGLQKDRVAAETSMAMVFFFLLGAGGEAKRRGLHFGETLKHRMTAGPQEDHQLFAVSLEGGVFFGFPF